MIIFHAGSLSAPFKEISRQFEAENPGLNVLLEAAGSVDCARKITELKKTCDLMASSDYTVIEKFLIPGYTGWHIPFAANEMVIAYTDESRRAAELTEESWPELMLDNEVAFARSDPGSDPCGYRTLMTFQLAGKYYAKDGLADALQRKDSRYIRPKEVDLLALMEVGEVDYIFIYRSVAMQHGLRFLELPDEMNLKSPDLSGIYQEAVVTIPGRQPGDSLLIFGEPMVYSITMLNNAPNQTAAMAFMKFLLSPEKGMKVMESMGQQSVIPSRSVYYQEVPEELKELITESR